MSKVILYVKAVAWGWRKAESNTPGSMAVLEVGGLTKWLGKR